MPTTITLTGDQIKCTKCSDSVEQTIIGAGAFGFKQQHPPDGWVKKTTWNAGKATNETLCPTCAASA